MSFELPAEHHDVAEALLEMEPQAPKAIKPFMIAGAQEIQMLRNERNDARKQVAEFIDQRSVHMQLAQELSIAASLRIGQMDTQSRADEVTREIRATLLSVAERLRDMA